MDDNNAIGAIGISFRLHADLIFIATDNVKLLNKLSSLRPSAYICVFTDNPTVKKLTAINFGVYCFPSQARLNPAEFAKTFGKELVIGEDLITILELSVNRSQEIDTFNIFKIHI